MKLRLLHPISQLLTGIGLWAATGATPATVISDPQDDFLPTYASTKGGDLA